MRSQTERFAALGAASLGGVAPGEGVEMDPAGVIFDESAQKQGGGRRASHGY